MTNAFWKKTPSDPHDDDAPTEPATPDARDAEVRAVFGDDAVVAFSRFGAPVAVHRAPPFFWADFTAPATTSGWLFDGSDAIALGTAQTLPLLVAQSITEPMDVVARAQAACRAGRLTVVDDADHLRRVMDSSRSPEERKLLLARFEPPHGEGSRWVFCVEESADRRYDDAWLYRCSVDADSLHVDIEPIGVLRRQRMLVRGRAHVDDTGAVVVAAVDARAATSPWIEQALTEHASIASFARLTLELMAAGAPLGLLARVQAAALDEVRHTEQCLALARRDGVDVDDLGPLPALAPRPGDRAAIARRTHDEAVVEESAAIVHMRTMLPGLDAAARDVVAAQIADEERHVQLARDIVAWATGAA